MKYKIGIILGTIFVVALLLRFYHLGITPHSMHDDEVANTYIGKYILLNGQDTYGNKWPLLYFDKFGDFPPVLPMYISGLGAFLFGDNAFASRFFMALIGSLIIFPVFRLSKRIFKNEYTALFTALMTAILPWHVVLSRVNAEGVLAVTVYMFALDLITESLHNKKSSHVILAILLFFLTYLLYPSFRIVVPLTLAPLLFLIPKDATKYFKIILISSIVVSFVLTLYISSTPWGKGRFNQTSIFTAVSGVDLRRQELIFNEKNIVVARIFNNKPLTFAREFVTQYFQYLSPNFLFIVGGNPKLYAVPNTGLVYITFGVLLILSCLAFFQKRNGAINQPLFIFTLYLFVISIIPSALTVTDAPNTHRSLLMGILLTILVGYGFNSLQKLEIKKISLQMIILFFISIEFILFSHNYFQHASYYESVYRNDGNKELAQYLIKNKSSYDSMYVTNEQRWLPLNYLFFSHDYSTKYIGLLRHDFRIDKINNVLFPEQPCPTNLLIEHKVKGEIVLSKKSIIINDGSCPVTLQITRFFTEVERIKRVNSTVAFIIYIPTEAYFKK